MTTMSNKFRKMSYARLTQTVHKGGATEKRLALSELARRGRPVQVLEASFSDQVRGLVERTARVLSEILAQHVLSEIKTPKP